MVSFFQPANADFNDIERKIQAYLHAYDGEVKSFEETEDKFEDLFHERFSHTMDGSNTIINKDQMRETAKNFLSMGTSACLVLFKCLGNHTFEVKLHFVNRLADIQTHLKGTVEEGKLIKIETCEEVERTCENNNLKNIPGLSELKNSFGHFILLQNDKESNGNNLQDVFDCLFYDSLVAAIGRAQLHKRGMRTSISVPDDFSQTEFTLDKFELLDQHHVEVKVFRDCVIRECKSTHEEWHDVFTVMDGTILAMESCVDFKNGSTKRVKKNRSTWPLLPAITQ